MSLEQALIDNTAAVRELTGLLSRPQLGGSLISEETVNTGASETAAAKTPAKPRAAKTTAAAPTQAPEVNTLPGGINTVPPVYEDVKAITLRLGEKKTRDDVVNLMKKYGATKGPEIKKEDYANYIHDAKVLLGEAAAEESLV